MNRRFVAELYCGRTYCGNGNFYTEQDALDWAQNDAFADKVKIIDLYTEQKKTIKLTLKEV